MSLTLHTDDGDLVYQPGYYFTRAGKILVVLQGSTYYLEHSQILEQLDVDIGELMFFEINSWVSQHPHLPGQPVGVGAVLRDRIILEESVRTDYYRTEMSVLTDHVEYTLESGQTVN